MAEPLAELPRSRCVLPGRVRAATVSEKKAGLSLGCLCLAIAGCISGSASTDHPLYPESAGKLDASQVARLVGYVQSVDGKDVSALGGSFLLLPGCHLVVTPSEWGKGDPVSGSAVTVQTGPLPFVLPMQAGRQYLIEVQVGTITGPTAPATIKAYERDARGKDLAELGPAQSDGDLQKCRDQMAQGAASAQ